MSIENYGRVIQVIGSVVDVEFLEGELPKLYDAVTIDMDSPDDSGKKIKLYL